VDIDSKLVIVFDFLEFLEGPIRYYRWNKVYRLEYGRCSEMLNNQYEIILYIYCGSCSSFPHS
jgi:hypothetical protein